MTREWAISDDDYKQLLYYLQETDRILDKAQFYDLPFTKIKEIIEGARLRDLKFKKE